VIAYKFLRRDATSVFTTFHWPLPPGHAGAPGPWVEAMVAPCRSGIHACRPADLPLWAGQVLYEVELGGDIVAQPTKLVASRGRLLRRIEEWDDAVADRYTRMCADRGHDLALAAAPPLEDWDAVIEASVPEGPALLGFVAARIAEERFGAAGYGAERARQTAWLEAELGV
jgi:hypothetical protein